jgi:hypothetical protein
MAKAHAVRREKKREKMKKMEAFQTRMGIAPYARILQTTENSVVSHVPPRHFHSSEVRGAIKQAFEATGHSRRSMTQHIGDLGHTL